MGHCIQAKGVWEVGAQPTLEGDLENINQGLLHNKGPMGP